jgi:hypothetical protein
MNLTIKCARFLVLSIVGLWLAVPALADDGDSALPAGTEADYTRPGSVIVFPLFMSGGGNIAACDTGNVLVNGLCLPRTVIELGATCPTRFTVGDQANIPCPEHEPVRVRFRWVCPGTERNPICRSIGFDVHLTVNGKVAFTANGFSLPDTNQVSVPAAPCDRGYLIGWVINEFGQPIKYDGLIGDAVIRNSGTATAAYRGITIQAFASTMPGSLIDPFALEHGGLPFIGTEYRRVTGQVTGDVRFDAPSPPASPGFGVSSALILLTLDVRSNAPNFPTFVDLDFWNGFETRLSTFVEFVCWGEFRLSADIHPNLTQAFMGTRTGVIQSDEAAKIAVGGIPDTAGKATLLGLVLTNEGPGGAPAARSFTVELYDNGIRFVPSIFFP